MHGLPANVRRRPVVLAGLAGLAGWTSPALALPARALTFPRDRGAHPDFRTEWWYITGRATSGARQFGFQLTFFRSRGDGTQGMASKFAAKQLLFAHAAITDVQGQKLWHDQRIARDGFGVAFASQDDMQIKLRDWSLKSQGGQYTAELPAADFGLKLQFNETQPVLLQGQQGLSRKGPQEKQASYYYSQPQLAATGSLQLKGQSFAVSGKAWLDHEWSEELLHPDAVGWDWIGMNLLDGSALTAFRLRDKNGNALWGGGSFRSPQGELRIFGHAEVVFKPLRRWTSALTQTAYPVEWALQTPTGAYTVKAVIDNQELDSRSSTGAIYWEGLSELRDSQGQPTGSGYLEMTGYAQALRL
ncbi:Predicted secreted hydrolase [Polaromonas sp. OV174]|uniref:lipocalin-like domain-containing protein n=1 Tax=Polaromonas sp. OV174 TaxID=1855300 RepID=UPI0008DED9B7|nr:lipocalin-like domain-containing protein [Polaromonas sp. OV174]SFC71094.1 Predicted secreted hydrolase [Polaromonas sp. OV174]